MLHYNSTEELQLHNPNTQYKTFWGHYLIGSDGTIFRIRLDRTLNAIQPQISKKGYCTAKFRMWGQARHISINVHRIVAALFLPQWDPELTVDHIDEDKTNNNISNLQMLTVGDNVRAYHQRRK